MTLDLARADILRHPRATRSATLGGQSIAYALTRTRRRTIGFTIGADGLSVAVPKWLALREVDTAVREKGAWILAKLAEQRERSAFAMASRPVWRDGATVAYLGRPLVLVLGAGCETGPDQAVLSGDSVPPSPRLHVGVPADAAEERVEAAVRSWLQGEARRVFAERVGHFAALLGVRVTRLALSSATTRWGSAGANGSVRLHWRLVQQPPATIDYVVAHELAHLREMNHSERFWSVVRSVLPDYEIARRSLRASEGSLRSGL